MSILFVEGFKMLYCSFVEKRLTKVPSHADDRLKSEFHPLLFYKGHILGTRLNVICTKAIGNNYQIDNKATQWRDINNRMQA